MSLLLTFQLVFSFGQMVVNPYIRHSCLAISISLRISTRDTKNNLFTLNIYDQVDQQTLKFTYSQQFYVDTSRTTDQLCALTPFRLNPGQWIGIVGQPGSIFIFFF